MCLHYLVKLKIRVFVEILMLEFGKVNHKKFLHIDFDFTYWKRCNLFTLTLGYGKFNQANMYKILSELA